MKLHDTVVLLEEDDGVAPCENGLVECDIDMRREGRHDHDVVILGATGKAVTFGVVLVPIRNSRTAAGRCTKGFFLAPYLWRLRRSMGNRTHGGGWLTVGVLNCGPFIPLHTRRSLLFRCTGGFFSVVFRILRVSSRGSGAFLLTIVPVRCEEPEGTEGTVGPTSFAVLASEPF